MNPTETTVWVLAGIGVVALLYMAQQATGDQPVPGTQSEEQAMGLGVGAAMRVNAGTPLDMRPEIHFWAPGFVAGLDTGGQPTVQPRHRYPAIPGGNMSTVMHQGFSAMMHKAPADNDWRITPPEAAVL